MPEKSRIKDLLRKLSFTDQTAYNMRWCFRIIAYYFLLMTVWFFIVKASGYIPLGSLGRDLGILLIVAPRFNRGFSGPLSRVRLVPGSFG